MKKQDKNTLNFRFGNSSLEYFSSYGMFFISIYLFVAIFYVSFFFFSNETLRYIFWFMTVVLFFSTLSCIFNYFFVLKKIKISESDFEFPKKIIVGQEDIIHFNLKNKKLNNIFLRLSIDSLEKNNISSKMVSDVKIFNGANLKKWGNYWSYGSKLGYNMFDVAPIDVEQISANEKSMKIFGKRRGKTLVTGLRFYIFDIFGFIRLYYDIPIEAKKIVIQPIVNKKNSVFFDFVNQISGNGHITNQNIIGIKKGKRGDSIKNTHWKIFAKKNEQWVFVKEKIDLTPTILWIDDVIESTQTKAEQFENMISDVFQAINENKVNYVIMQGVYYDLTVSRELLLDKLLDLEYNENLEREINSSVLDKITTDGKIIFVTTNNIKSNIFNQLNVEMMKRNIPIMEFRYE